MSEIDTETLGIKQKLECLLFVASEPLSVKQLAELTETAPARLREILPQLAAEYEQRGFHLRQIAGGWQFTTDADLSPLIEKLYRPKFQQLSVAAMETLAIIAYKQPITRAEISEIRQVEADSVVSTLMDKRLIREVGRMDIPGRPILYGTSSQFLSFFGINSLADLPDLPVVADPGQTAAENETTSEQ